MSKCDTCINKKYCANHLDARTMCPQTDYVLFTPTYKTRADLLRAMMDEELARYYAKRIVRCYGCEAVTEDNCFECQLDWLKSPVEKEADE